MNTGLEANDADEIQPSGRTRRAGKWSTFAAGVAVAVLGVAAADKAFTWDSYSPPENAAPTWWQGQEDERLRAMGFGNDFAVDYIDMAVEKLESGTEREKMQAKLGLKRIRKHLPN